jgi:hypothetical protein
MILVAIEIDARQGKIPFRFRCSPGIDFDTDTDFDLDRIAPFRRLFDFPADSLVL